MARLSPLVGLARCVAVLIVRSVGVMGSVRYVLLDILWPILMLRIVVLVCSAMSTIVSNATTLLIYARYA